VKVKIKLAFPPNRSAELTPRPSPLPTGRQAQGERELTLRSPPLPAPLRGARPGTGGDIGEGKYVNFYYSFTINRERDA